MWLVWDYVETKRHPDYRYCEKKPQNISYSFQISHEKNINHFFFAQYLPCFIRYLLQQNIVHYWMRLIWFRVSRNLLRWFWIEVFKNVYHWQNNCWNINVLQKCLWILRINSLSMFILHISYIFNINYISSWLGYFVN